MILTDEPFLFCSMRLLNLAEEVYALLSISTLPNLKLSAPLPDPLAFIYTHLDPLGEHWSHTLRVFIDVLPSATSDSIRKDDSQVS